MTIPTEPTKRRMCMEAYLHSMTAKNDTKRSSEYCRHLNAATTNLRYARRARAIQRDREYAARQCCTIERHTEIDTESGAPIIVEWRH